MLTDAAWRTLQILFFRAGPQDFPFGEMLGRWVPMLAAVGNMGFLAVVLPIPLAAVISVTMVLVLALYTRTILRARDLAARFQQTFNALLATDLALKIAMLPAFVLIAPKLSELASKPELLENPEQFVLPAGPTLIANLISYWSLAVSTNIYRQAANTGIFVGLLLAFLGLLILLFATAIASGIFRGLVAA